MLESFRSLRKSFCELMLSCRIDKKIRPHHEAHEGHEGFILFYTFELRTTIIASFPCSRKFLRDRVLGIGLFPAKSRRAPSSDNYFLCGLCVFAGDIRIFGCGVSRAVCFDVL